MKQQSKEINTFEDGGNKPETILSYCRTGLSRNLAGFQLCFFKWRFIMKKVFAKTVGLILSAALCMTSFPAGSYAQEILTQDLQEEQIIVRGEE